MLRLNLIHVCKFWRRTLPLAQICCHHHVFIYALIFVQMYLSILCITSFHILRYVCYWRRAKSVLVVMVASLFPLFLCHVCAASRCYVTSSYLLCDVIFVLNVPRHFNFDTSMKRLGCGPIFIFFVNFDVYHDLDHLNDLVTGEDGW